MQITWYGQSCFKIVSGQNTIIIDPFKKEFGLTPPRGKADILLVSDSDVSKDDIFVDAEFIASAAGEYETKGIHIFAFSEFYEGKKHSKRVTAYVVDIEGIRVCHLSDFSKEHITEFLDKFGDVDILMLPISGKYTKDGVDIDSLDADVAGGIISDIDPRVVIPMNFKLPQLKLSVESSEKFEKAYSLSGGDAIDKYTVKKRDLPSEGRNIVLMKLT